MIHEFLMGGKSLLLLPSFTFFPIHVFLSGKHSFPVLSECFNAPFFDGNVKLRLEQEADIRKFFHTILENRHFVTDPRTLERENQNGPLETPVPREKTHKSGKSGSIPAKNGFFSTGAQSESDKGKRYPSHNGKDTLLTCLCQ
jgi:hypothetical protein